MTDVKITINGASFPCRQTMGAMLRFKRETGKEVTELKADSITDLVTYLWCCITSACKHDGINFDLPLMDFADSISNEDITEWASVVFTASAEADGDKAEKKSL